MNEEKLNAFLTRVLDDLGGADEANVEFLTRGLRHSSQVPAR